jgi:hypothetical protein
MRGDRLQWKARPDAGGAERGASPVACLTCTELPLAILEVLAMFEFERFAHINATASHVAALFAQAVSRA